MELHNFCFSLLNVSHLKSIWYSFQAVLYRSAMAFERCSFHLENETLPEKGSLFFKQTCCHLKYAVFKCIWREEIHTIFRKQHVPLKEAVLLKNVQYCRPWKGEGFLSNDTVFLLKKMKSPFKFVALLYNRRSNSHWQYPVFSTDTFM